MSNKEIISIINNAQNIAIFSHKDPDPDALGSLFGVKAFCQTMGKNADIFVKHATDRYLDYIFPVSDAREDFLSKNFDLIIFVDMHTVARIDEVFHKELFLAEAQDKNFLVIDHHTVSENEELISSNVKLDIVPSCSQLVLGLFKEVGAKPDEFTASYLYAGLMGDTNRFLHSNVDRSVFEDALFLFDCGARIQRVYDFMYRYKTKNNLRMNKFFLDHLQFIENDKVGYLVVSEKDRKHFDMDIEDVKFYADQIIAIKDVELSFLCYERENGEYKISMRSVGELNLIDFSAKMGGGGHPNAAGFQVLKTTKKKIEKEIKSWAKELLNA